MRESFQLSRHHMSTHPFENEDEHIFNLNGERYLRIKSYRATETFDSLSDHELTEMLLRQPFYEHLLVGPIGYDERDKSVQASGQHGPCDLKKLSPALYYHLSVDEFRKRLQAHYDDPFYRERRYMASSPESQDEDPVPDSVIEDINTFLNRLPLGESRIFSLEINLNDSEYLGDLPLHSDFQEYIIFEPKKGRIHLFIIAWD